MKTFIYYFLSIILFPSLGTAQEYCEVTYTQDIEPITFVGFSDLNHSTSPEVNGSPGHEYFHEDFALFASGLENETYPINLQGNTNGNHTDTFTVFIDWNGDEDFTDGGEMIPAGSITNSTGTDGQQTGTEISVPSSSTGDRRMRIIKQRTSTENPVWPEDPCSIF